MATPPGYVELRARSAFSFLQGASNPEDLADRAAELDYPALALADRGGVYGAPRFHQPRDAGACARSSAPRSTSTRATPRCCCSWSRPEGWRRLCRLITVGQAGSEKNTCRVGWDAVEEHARDWTVLLRGDERLSPTLLDRASGVFGRERIWVDVSRHLTGSRARRETRRRHGRGGRRRRRRHR